MVGFQGPRENIKETKDENNEKLLSVFLAFALLLSFVTPAFAYQGAKTADTAAQAEKAHDPATCTDCP